MKQPTAGPACPEINALPEFLQDILKELYQHSLAEGYPDIFLNACKTLKEIIPEVKCPCIPYTIAWQLWFRGFTRGFVCFRVSHLHRIFQLVSITDIHSPTYRR